jgi:hypothetical protein
MNAFQVKEAVRNKIWNDSDIPGLIKFGTSLDKFCNKLPTVSYATAIPNLSTVRYQYLSTSKLN